MPCATLTRAAAASCATLLLAACTEAPPSFGARLQSEAGEVSALGARWEQGETMVEQGRELVEDGREHVDEGEALLAQGRKEIRRGEVMIERGREMQREAETAYRSRPSPAPAG